MKERLDNVLVKRGLCETRSRARSLILAGKVYIDGRLVDKAG
ncbi:MAG: TlyA family rRNA (cytidine-2'-O)-methyltransferase, partial [Firmicutes bacterium HGW-Firmicutes-13]